jgi:hypothetical protein
MCEATQILVRSTWVGDWEAGTKNTPECHGARHFTNMDSIDSMELMGRAQGLLSYDTWYILSPCPVIPIPILCLSHSPFHLEVKFA